MLNTGTDGQLEMNVLLLDITVRLMSLINIRKKGVKELTQEYDKMLLAVTHNLDFAEKSGRIIELHDGMVLRA